MKFKIVYIWGNTSRNPYHQHILFCSYKAAEKHFLKTKREYQSLIEYNKALLQEGFDHRYEIQNS